MKTCSKCKELKEHGSFYRDKGGKDGRSSRCKDCTYARQKAYRSRPEVIEYRRKYYGTQPRTFAFPIVDGHKKCLGCFVSKHVSEYPAHRNKQARCRECNNARHKLRREANPEAIRQRDQRRRALKLNAAVPGMSSPNLSYLVRFYGKACLVPGCENEVPTLDHVVPLSKGGKDTYGNSQPLCRNHNSSKRHHHSTDYRSTANIGNRKQGIIITDISPIGATI